MKKLILTAATVLFISGTVLCISLTAFAKGNGTTAETKCGEDTTKSKMQGKVSEEKKEGTAADVKDKPSESKIIPATKKYFMIPMIDSLVDTTKGGC